MGRGEETGIPGFRCSAISVWVLGNWWMVWWNVVRGGKSRAVAVQVLRLDVYDDGYVLYLHMHAPQGFLEEKVRRVESCGECVVCQVPVVLELSAFVVLFCNCVVWQ